MLTPELIDAQRLLGDFITGLMLGGAAIVAVGGWIIERIKRRGGDAYEVR